MDFFLFVLLLVGFAVFYVALQIYLVFTLIILITIAIFYIVLKYPRGKDDWPYGFTDNIYTAGMSNVIILVFILVVPTIPFIGSQLRYPARPPPDGWEIILSSRDPYMILFVILAHAIFYLILFAILIPHLQLQISKASGGTSGEWEKEGSGKPKIGMGA